MYLVGGIVRDDLLNLTSKDIDICLDTGFLNMKRISQLLMNAFPDRNVQFIERFNNVKLSHDNFNIDIVPFRKEFYKGASNYPSIHEGTFIDDVLRRDFTINSIYMKYMGKGCISLIDPLGGLRDINNHTLKLNYHGSFSDDPTRMIRMFIYQHRLGFEIDHHTIKEIDAELMTKINPSLVFSLVQDFLQEPTSKNILESLIEWRLLDGFGITDVGFFEPSINIREQWGNLIEVNPKLIKTFEDLGIYSKLLKKIRKG
jgi:tRNA nucleotidyltransferase/poly(A) polymerase